MSDYWSQMGQQPNYGLGPAFAPAMRALHGAGDYLHQLFPGFGASAAVPMQRPPSGPMQPQSWGDAVASGGNYLAALLGHGGAGSPPPPAGPPSGQYGYPGVGQTPAAPPFGGPDAAIAAASAARRAAAMGGAPGSGQYGYPGVGAAPGSASAAPAAQSDPVTPRSTSAPAPAAAAQDQRWGTVQYQVPGSGQGRNHPIYTAFNPWGRG